MCGQNVESSRTRVNCGGVQKKLSAGDEIFSKESG